MKVFLTGATGYIGSDVAGALKRHGHEVFGLARSDAAASKLTSAGVKPVRGDLHDSARITEAARSADGVIHTAAVRGPDAVDADRAAVEAILAALANTTKPFIYTSGIWVVGNTRDHVAD